MSAIFQHVTFAECCQEAEAVRGQYWPQQTIPVDIDHIIEFGIKLKVIPLDNLRNDLDIYGFLSNDRTAIFVDNGMMVLQKFEAALRFTMAHELGHFFLHRDFYRQNRVSSARDWMTLLSHVDNADLRSYEDQADEFAGRLLIPLNRLLAELASITQDLIQFKKIVTSRYNYREEELHESLLIVVAEKLAPRFNVPLSVMYKRLTHEKIDILRYACVQ